MVVLSAIAALLFLLFLAFVAALFFKPFFYTRFNRPLSDERQNLRYEFTTRLSALEKMNYEVLSGSEEIIYDGRNGIGGNDFTGNGSLAWDYVAHSFADGIGAGSHIVEGNVITIHRTNTTGRYEIYLKRFVFNGKECGNIPASTKQPSRKFCLRCEVKKGTASHVLRFVFKGEATKEVLDEKDYVVFNPGWQKAEVFFSVAATEDCLFRIDDLEVMAAPSNVQIRNLLLVEKR